MSQHPARGLEAEVDRQDPSPRLPPREVSWPRRVRVSPEWSSLRVRMGPSKRLWVERTQEQFRGQDAPSTKTFWLSGAT